MIIANNVASKLFVAFVAAAMLFTLAAPAKAATVEELQAQIAALMAQISGMSGSTGTTAACTFTRSLTVGSEGADVKCLQDALTPTYFNNAGGSTGYFGPLTQSAVAAWQSANGISPAAGYFGPVSQAKFAATVGTPSTPTTPGSDDSDDEDDSDDSSDLSGEASLDSVEVSDGDDTDDVEEGSEDAQVAEIEVTFEDGDAVINRIDLALEVASGNDGEDDPWEVFSEVSLWVDGDEVARMDASDEDEYLDEDDGSLRFSGLDIVAMEDEEVVITVAVSVNDTVDGVAASNDEDWTVAVGGIRYTDADDVTTTDTDAGDIIDITDATIVGNAAAVDFSIDVEGAGDELDLESSDEDPDSTTFALDEDDNTEEAIFAFDLSAEDSDGDIDLNEIVVGVQVAGAGTSINTLVNDFRIEVDGESFDAESYTGTGSSTELTFDIDGDITVAAEETITVVLFADFENMSNTALQGSTITATTTTGDIDAEGSDTGEDVTVGGSSSLTSDTHTLRTEGADVSVTEVDETSKANTDSSTDDDEGVYTIEFEVTAFGDDLYIDDVAGRGTTMGTDGVNFTVQTSGSATTSGTAVATLDSDAEETSGGFYLVREGETETFTLTVEYDPAVTGSYKVVLHSVNFNDTADTAPETQQTLSPATDYDTASLTI